MKILSINPQQDPDGKMTYWAVDLQRSSRLSLNAPKEGIALWPFPRQGASLLEKNHQKLPPGVFGNTVKAAVDLNSDKDADLLIVEFSCQNQKKAPSDSTCGEVWGKKDGNWKLCDSLLPL